MELTRQLGLFDSTPYGDPGDSEKMRNYPLRGIKHGITTNPTARGIYYVYWYQQTHRLESGHEYRLTHKAHIRGGSVGSELGESRRMQVESWIASGLHPWQITSQLRQLPRSKRRSRYPDWESVRA
jgi:hypothetical protein